MTRRELFGVLAATGVMPAGATLTPPPAPVPALPPRPMTWERFTYRAASAEAIRAEIESIRPEPGTGAHLTERIWHEHNSYWGEARIFRPLSPGESRRMLALKPVYRTVD